MGSRIGTRGTKFITKTKVDLKATFGEVLGRKIGMEHEKRKMQIVMLKNLPNFKGVRK